jgi:hypothetical protein
LVPLIGDAGGSQPLPHACTVSNKIAQPRKFYLVHKYLIA